MSGRTEGAATSTFLRDTGVAPAPLLAAGTDRVILGLGPLYVVRSDGTTRTLARDALGSARAEVNDAGAVTASFRYAAYGEIVQVAPSGATPTVLGFTGELRDPSGLIYLRARWYDSGTGRFMTSDPVAGEAAQPVTLNIYTYAYGDPVIVTDPSGRCGFLISVCVGAVIGAVTGGRAP